MFSPEINKLYDTLKAYMSFKKDGDALAVELVRKDLYVTYNSKKFLIKFERSAVEIYDPIAKKYKNLKTDSPIFTSLKEEVAKMFARIVEEKKRLRRQTIPKLRMETPKPIVPDEDSLEIKVIRALAEMQEVRDVTQKKEIEDAGLFARRLLKTGCEAAGLEVLEDEPEKNYRFLETLFSPENKAGNSRLCKEIFAIVSEAYDLVRADKKSLDITDDSEEFLSKSRSRTLQQKSISPHAIKEGRVEWDGGIRINPELKSPTNLLKTSSTKSSSRG